MPLGANCYEIEQALALEHQSASARMVDLKREELVEPLRDKSGEHIRRPTGTRRWAGVWVVTKAGREVLDGKRPKPQSWNDPTGNYHRGNPYSRNAYEQGRGYHPIQALEVLRFITKRTPPAFINPPAAKPS